MNSDVSSTVDATSFATAPAPEQRVLVVEDQELLASLVEELLTTAGYRVVKLGRIEAALDLVRDRSCIDVAVLDINLNGVEVFPLAMRLRELGIPFMFCSGYGRQGLPPEFAGCVVVQKPYLPQELTRALAQCLSGTGAG